MLKKVGISLLGAMMLSSVALACNNSSIDDEDFLCDFALVDGGGNKQESKQEERKVLTFDKVVVKKIMMEDGFDDSGADFMVAGYAGYSSRMQNILDSYLADRTISDEVIAGINIKKVMDKHKLTFWNAFCLMDAYLKEPNGAEKLEKFGMIEMDRAEIDKIFKSTKVKGQ